MNARGGPPITALFGQWPITIGRRGCDLNLDEPGVWDRHFTIGLEDLRWTLICRSEASVRVGGVSVQRAALRAGDLIECGSVRLRFDFAKPKVSTFRGWAILLWLGIAALTVAEIWIALEWPGQG